MTRAGEMELRDVLARLVAKFDAMPDAGLTDDDPRSGWYAESHSLRVEAHLLLGDPSWVAVFGASRHALSGEDESSQPAPASHEPIGPDV